MRFLILYERSFFLKGKRFISMLLMLFVLMSLTVPAFAATSEHECTYNTWISYEYTDHSAYQHEVKMLRNYDCTDCSCPIEYSEVISVSYASHDFTEMKWSGQHYHSGARHYGYYSSQCFSCKHSTGEWRSWSCPGGSSGSCILPQMLNPTHTIK